MSKIIPMQKKSEREIWECTDDYMKNKSVVQASLNTDDYMSGHVRLKVLLQKQFQKQFLVSAASRSFMPATKSDTLFVT
jgi:hypothetical protein